MVIIRYFQLCWQILKVILGRYEHSPTRKPRGDIRNFARSFYFSYMLMEHKREKEKEDKNGLSSMD